MLRLNNMQRPSHRLPPITPNMLRNSANHVRARVLKDPILATAVQQDGIIRQNDERLGPVLAHHVYKLGGDCAGECRHGVVACSR